MHVDSMIDARGSTGTITPTIRDRLAGLSVGRVVVIALALLVEAFLVLGFVAASLGVGNEGHAAGGPDRPAPPVMTR
jgi:hypothetical protein